MTKLMVVTMTQSNIAYLAMIVITVVELQVYWSGKLNAVHVALVVHSKVTELNTGGNCTSSTKKKKKKIYITAGHLPSFH